VRTILLVGVLACSSPRFREVDPKHWKQIGPYAYAPRGPNPDCMVRGTEEYASWIAVGAGAPIKPVPDGVLAAAIGAEATLPLAWHDNLRIGPWIELGGDTSELLHASGGVAFVLGNLPDPYWIRKQGWTHGEGAIELRLGAGWRGAQAIPLPASRGGELAAILAFGSRRYTEGHDGSIDYPSCDGSTMVTPYPGARIRAGHGGPGYAFGMRWFVEVERSFDDAVQIIAGMEIDPISEYFARRWGEPRGTSGGD
jgi:hypothetical protein